MIQMTHRTIPAEKIWPVAHIDGNGIVLTRRGQLVAGYEIEFPVAYSVGEEEYDELLSCYYAACRVLPGYTILHRLDVYLNEEYSPEEKGGFLSRCYEKHFEGRTRLTHRAYLFISTSTKALAEKDVGSTVLFRGFPSHVAVPSQERFDEWLGKCSEFTGAFCNSGRTKLRRLTRADWLGEGDDPGLVQRYLQLGSGSPLMSEPECCPADVKIHDKVAQCFEICESDQLPGEYSTTLKVESLSSMASEVRLSYASRLGLLLPCEHVLSQTIVIPSQQDINGQLDGKRKRMTSGFTSADNRINGGEISGYLDDAYRYNLITVRANASVIAWSEERDMMKIRSLVSSALTSMGITGVANTHDAPVVFFGCCPACEGELGEQHMMTQNLLSMLAFSSFETFEKSVEGGCLKLCDRMTHTPLTIDTYTEAYRRGWISNMNEIIVGGSGSGKSFSTNKLVQDCYDAGHHITIIDVGDSYEGLTNIINEESGGKDGQYYSWSMEHPFTFNPFIGFDREEERDGTDEEMTTSRDQTMNFILSFLKTAYDPAGGWTPARANILTSLVTRFFDWYGASGKTENPIFDDFYRYVDEVAGKRIRFESVYSQPRDGESVGQSLERLALKEADEKANGYYIGTSRVTPEDFDVKDFCLSLDAYRLGGRFGFLLNDRNPRDLFASRFNVFEVDALQQVDDGTKEKKFYSLCILCIMNAFDRKMRQDKTSFKHLIVEEAWTAISNETMAPFLRSLWKTARKFNTSACVVTQEINDILSNDIIKETIIKNSSIKRLLSQANNASTFDRIADYLGLSRKMCNLVLSINRQANPYSPHSKEIFIQLEDKKAGVYDNEVSPQQAIAFESAKNRKIAFFTLAREKGSFIGALREMTGMTD